MNLLFANVINTEINLTILPGLPGLWETEQVILSTGVC